MGAASEMEPPWLVSIAIHWTTHLFRSFFVKSTSFLRHRRNQWASTRTSPLQSLDYEEPERRPYRYLHPFISNFGLHVAYMSYYKTCIFAVVSDVLTTFNDSPWCPPGLCCANSTADLSGVLGAYQGPPSYLPLVDITFLFLSPVLIDWSIHASPLGTFTRFPHLRVRYVTHARTAAPQPERKPTETGCLSPKRNHRLLDIQYV